MSIPYGENMDDAVHPQDPKRNKSGWLHRLWREFSTKTPIQQIELLKKIGIFGLFGALGFGAYSFIFPQEKSADKYHHEATIKDPDGFTNVRSMPNKKGQIVTIIKDGEIFYTYQQQETWWHIKTRGNQYGFVHSTRIRLRN